MPHRGRLNLLTDLLQYSPAGLFHKIKGGSELPDDLGAEGDVLSHLGRYLLPFGVSSSCFLHLIRSRQLTVFFQLLRLHLHMMGRLHPLKYLFFQILRISVSSLLFFQYFYLNPALEILPEAINPVALGKTRAKQYALLKNSPEDCKLGDRVMCVQLHGDASFTGQGVVMESLGLSEYQLQIGVVRLLK